MPKTASTKLSKYTLTFSTLAARIDADGHTVDPESSVEMIDDTDLGDAIATAVAGDVLKYGDVKIRVKDLTGVIPAAGTDGTLAIGPTGGPSKSWQAVLRSVGAVEGGNNSIGKRDLIFHINGPVTGS